MNNPLINLLDMLEQTGMKGAWKKIHNALEDVLKSFDQVSDNVQDMVLDYMSKNEYDKASEVLKIPSMAKKAKDYVYNNLYFTAKTEPKLSDKIREEEHVSSLERVPLYKKQEGTKPHYIEIDGKRNEVPNHSWIGLFHFVCEYLYSKNQHLFAEWVSLVKAEKKTRCSFAEFQSSAVPTMCKRNTTWKRICYSNIYVCLSGTPNYAAKYALWALKYFGIEKDIYVLREEREYAQRGPKPKKDTSVVHKPSVEPSLPILKVGSVVKSDEWGVGTLISIDGEGRNVYAVVKHGEDIHRYRMKKGGCERLTIVQMA